LRPLGCIADGIEPMLPQRLNSTDGFGNRRAGIASQLIDECLAVLQQIGGN
jgi:hypothetical protein